MMVAPAFQGANTLDQACLAQPGEEMLRCASPGLSPKPVHRREVPDRIARMRVHDELRARGRARGEIEEHRVVGFGRAVGGEELRCRAAWRNAARSAGPGRPRCARRPPQAPRISPRRRHARPDISPGRARSGRRCRLGPSVGIAGISTRPSFIDASIVAHSSGTTPSIIRRRSPRLAPSERRPLARRDDSRREIGEGPRLDALADDLERDLSPMLSRGEFGVEPFERPVELTRARPGEGGARAVIVVAELEQPVARLAEGQRLRSGAGRGEGGERHEADCDSA